MNYRFRTWWLDDEDVCYSRSGARKHPAGLCRSMCGSRKWSQAKVSLHRTEHTEVSAWELWGEALWGRERQKCGRRLR